MLLKFSQMENLTASPQLLGWSQETLNWILQVDINWNELDLSCWLNLSTPTVAALFHLEWSHATPSMRALGSSRVVVFLEATGFAICFQNHIDYNKLYIKHCLVLSWVKARGGGAEFLRTLPSLAWCHTWPLAFSSIDWLAVSFSLVTPSKVFLPIALLASSWGRSKSRGLEEKRNEMSNYFLAPPDSQVEHKRALPCLYLDCAAV